MEGVRNGESNTSQDSGRRSDLPGLPSGDRSGGSDDMLGRQLDNGRTDTLVQSVDSQSVASSPLPPKAVSARQIELPHVAKTPSLVRIPTRGKVETPKPHVAIQSDRPPVVEAVKASAKTWAFRLRWNSLPGRPAQYISRVTDTTYNLLTENKEAYGRYKKQLVAIHQGTVRAGN